MTFLFSHAKTRRREEEKVNEEVFSRERTQGTQRKESKIPRLNIERQTSKKEHRKIFLFPND
jgi:hypothetical protein